MSYYMQKDGRRVLAELLAGGSGKINGMYVEYGDNTDAAGPRTLEYFENLKWSSAGAGYARVAVNVAYVDDNLAVHFDAIVRGDDFQDSVPDRLVSIKCATLAVLDKDRSKDRLVCTVGFDKPVQLVPGAYVTVHASIKLGA